MATFNENTVCVVAAVIIELYDNSDVSFICVLRATADLVHNDEMAIVVEVNKNTKPYMCWCLQTSSRSHDQSCFKQCFGSIQESWRVSVLTRAETQEQSQECSTSEPVVGVPEKYPKK